MTHQDLQTELKGLITLNVDAAEGFDKAGDMALSDGLKEWLKMRMLEREAMAVELAALVRDIEGVDLDVTSFKSKVHRAWMDLKETFTTETDAMIVKECLRGESTLLDTYVDVKTNLNAITTVSDRLKGHIEMVEKAKVGLSVLQEALTVESMKE